jgi:hypothetical protein
MKSMIQCGALVQFIYINNIYHVCLCLSIPYINNKVNILIYAFTDDFLHPLQVQEAIMTLTFQHHHHHLALPLVPHHHSPPLDLLPVLVTHCEISAVSLPINTCIKMKHNSPEQRY